MMALESLEILLSPSPLCDQPIGLRIGNVTGKRQIETKSGLVDEIVHIGFVAAVIIAAEEAAPVPVQGHPVSEMDRADASKASSCVHVARHPVDHVKNHAL